MIQCGTSGHWSTPQLKAEARDCLSVPCLLEFHVITRVTTIECKAPSFVSASVSFPWGWRRKVSVLIPLCSCLYQENSPHHFVITQLSPISPGRMNTLTDYSETTLSGVRPFVGPALSSLLPWVLKLCFCSQEMFLAVRCWLPAHFLLFCPEW